MSNDKNYTRGYVKGWTDRHNHGQELPSDLSNAINELHRLLTREEAGLPTVKPRKPVYVSGAKKPKKAARSNPIARKVWEAAKHVLATNGPMLPSAINNKLLELHDPEITKYVTEGQQRLGVMMVYNSKCDEPQVKRVKDGYELIPNGGTQ